MSPVRSVQRSIEGQAAGRSRAPHRPSGAGAGNGWLPSTANGYLRDPHRANRSLAMNIRTNVIPIASAGPSRPSSASPDMTGRRSASELSGYGCAVIEKLLTPEECRAIAALYPHEEHFRSHVHMARHGFGKGEYRYFKYPLPDLHRRPAHRALSAPGADRQRMERAHGHRPALSRRARGFPEALPRRRPDAADAAAAAICAGRLQLPAPGSLRRSRLPAAGGDPAVRAGHAISPAASSC